MSFYDVIESLLMTVIDRHSFKSYWIIYFANMKLLLTPFAEIFCVSIGDNTQTLHSHTINRFSSVTTGFRLTGVPTRSLFIGYCSYFGCTTRQRVVCSLDLATLFFLSSSVYLFRSFPLFANKKEVVALSPRIIT